MLSRNKSSFLATQQAARKAYLKPPSNASTRSVLMVQEAYDTAKRILTEKVPARCACARAP